MYRATIALAVAVVILLALAVPTFSQTLDYSSDYKFDGTIKQQMQAGHLCNTGAELKQTIAGQGSMTKLMDVTMVRGKLIVNDKNDWVTAADAVSNLTVTSVFKLCAPPKMTYETDGFKGIVRPTGWYGLEEMPRLWMGTEWLGVNSPYEENEDLGEYDNLSKQIWAVQVEAFAGYSGSLHHSAEAAYGPYTRQALKDSTEGWALNRTRNTASRGVDYVGNLFNIDQYAYTSMGVVKRFVDISSPWSHGWLMINSTITGMAEVDEEFKMNNISPGSAVSKWWDLF